MKPLGPVFDASWRDRCSVQRVSVAQVLPMLLRHYLRKRPAVVPCALVVYLDGSIAPVGCCVFAMAPKQTSVRYGGKTWELARLWIDDSIPANAETWLIGQAVQYVRKNFPGVRFLVSYADPSAGHQGTIYRAANWTVDGRTDQERKSPRCDYVAYGQTYTRWAHVPAGAEVQRKPRVSKPRFFLKLKPSRRSIKQECAA